MFTGDTYLQPDIPDPVLADDVVLRIARRHLAKVVSVTAVDESGGEARVYVCDGDIVVKTQRPHRLRARTSLAKEVLILEHLAALDGLAIPRVLGYGNDSDVEYIVMTRIPGIALEAAKLESQARNMVLENLGETLRRIHEADQTALDESSLIPGDKDGADLRERVASGFDALIAAVEAHGSVAGMDLRNIADVCLAGLPVEFRPVVLHSNPGAAHCLVDPRTGLFAGLIDFADAYRSHPAFDIRVWSSLADSRPLLSGYSRRGPLGEGFEAVRRCGIVLTQLRDVARGSRDLQGAFRSIERLLDES